MLHAGEPSGDAGENVFFVIPDATAWSSLSKATLVLLHGSRVGLVFLADADGIDDDEVVFVRGIGRDALQIVRLDDADATALHLLEEGAGFTARMKTTISSGLMSVPVAIMSTVTAMRGW